MNSEFEEAAQRFLQLATRLRRLGAGVPPEEVTQISPSHLALLEYVATAPGCGVKEIATGLNLSAATVSISVRQMEKLDWLARQPHPNDKRAIQLFVTAKGTGILDSSHAFHRQKFEQLLSGLTPDERDTLLTLLERAISAAEQDN